MSQVTEVKQRISEAYKENCTNSDVAPNKALLRFLEEPEAEKETFNLIFRGNHKLNFSSRLSDEDVILLCAAAEPYAQYISHVDFSYNLISDTGINSLARLLSMIPNLESINLQGNQIEIDGAKVLAEHIKDKTSVEYINLNLNNIQTDGVLQIVLVLFNNKALRELHLADNKIDHDGISGIMSVLGWHNNTLEVLNVDNANYSSIGQEIAIHIAKMLQTNRGLEKLSLRKHALNSEGLYTITEHLLDNNKLRVLDLSCNKLTYKGCEHLGKFMLSDNCVLESLNLANNRTGHYGAKAMALALSKNKTLMHLDMTTNDIDDDGLRMLGQSLYENETLVSLKLYWNHFGQNSLRVFHDLRYNTKNAEYQTQYYLDFDTYEVDGELQMCHVENHIPYDIKVDRPYYVDE